MQKTNWTAIVILAIVGLLLVLLVGGSLLPFGRGGWATGGRWIDADCGGMMSGWRSGGMMGGWGFAPLGWIFGLAGLLLPLGLLGLLVLGGVWLFRQIAPSQGDAAGIDTAKALNSCPSCNQPVQIGWQLCPYCGQSLAPPQQTAANST